MAKPKKSALPEFADEVDVLRIENLLMKANAAQANAMSACAEYEKAIVEAARKYSFDPSKDGIDSATRKIVRK